MGLLVDVYWTLFTDSVTLNNTEYDRLLVGQSFNLLVLVDLEPVKVIFPRSTSENSVYK